MQQPQPQFRQRRCSLQVPILNGEGLGWRIEPREPIREWADRGGSARCRLRWASAAANRGDCDGGVQQLIGPGGRVIGLGGIPLTHPQDHFLQVLMPHL